MAFGNAKLKKELKNTQKLLENTEELLVARTQEISRLSGKNLGLTDSNGRLLAERFRAQSEIRLLLEELAPFRAIEETLRHQIRSLQASVAESVPELTFVRAKEATLRSQNADFEIQLRRSQQEMTDLKSQHEAAMKLQLQRYEALQQLLAKKEAELTEKEKEIEKAVRPIYGNDDSISSDDSTSSDDSGSSDDYPEDGDSDDEPPHIGTLTSENGEGLRMLENEN